MTLTLFTVLKSVDDPLIKMIQTNAINSWKHIQPKPRIIAFGSKPDAEQFCSELSIEYGGKLKTNEEGLEIVTGAFFKSWFISDTHWYCYVNADIILPPTFAYVPGSVDAELALIIGHRQNYEMKHLLTFENGWWDKLKSAALASGHRHSPNGIDYFIHKRCMFDEMPQLFVGSFYWDNYMLEYCKKLRYPIIDATDVIFAIHQNHPSTYRGDNEPSLHNRSFISDLMTINDADQKMTKA